MITSLQAIGTDMEQLAPIEAYQESIATFSGKRLGLVVGLVFGGLMLAGLAATTAILVPSHDRGTLPWPFLAGLAALSGAFFGFTFPRSLKRRLLRASEAVYSGTGAYETLPPPGAFTHRLPCSVLNGRLEVGGVLYLGQGLATFVPHSMNLPRHGQSLVIADGTACEVRTHARSNTLLAAIAGTGLPDLIEITSPLGTWQLNTPRAAEIAAELRSLLGPPTT
jgi:hypothetical protein